MLFLKKLPGSSTTTKVFLIVALIFGAVVVSTFPARSYPHTASADRSDGFLGFYGAEINADRIRYTWSSSLAILQYPVVPRYVPLELRVRLGLQRPSTAPPARLEVYTRRLEPRSEAVLLTVIESNPTNRDVRDYYLSIPGLEAGKGLEVEFRSNTFRPTGDQRELGFIFVESNLSLPLTHLLNLFWPHPFWLAGLLLLAVVVSWSLRTNLTFFETLLLTGMVGFVLVSMMPSTYQNSWWLLGVALGLAGLSGLDAYLQAQGKTSLVLLLSANALFISFFLLTPDVHTYDIKFYHDWSASVQSNGVWNIYNNSPTLNYLPLIVYVLWFYNLVAYPFGWQGNDTTWRITASLLFLAVVVVAGLIWRTASKAAFNYSSREPFQARRLIVFGFNLAILYNPAIWSQSDILPLLMLMIAFYFIYRRQPLASGLVLGLVAISKPQAWFVLPLLGWMFVQRCGWRKAIPGLVLGGIVALTMLVIAFGADWNSFNAYWSQSQLAGEYDNGIPTAFNLSFLVLDNQRVAIPTWLSILGFGLAGLTLLWLFYTMRGRNHSLQEYGLAATLSALACFVFLIKMKERYLLYGLPFMGQAALGERKFVMPFMLLSWLQLIHLVTYLYEAGPWGKRGLINNFYLWSALLSQEWLRRLISIGTLALFGYLAFLYWQQLRLGRRESEVSSHLVEQPAKS